MKKTEGGKSHEAVPLNIVRRKNVLKSHDNCNRGSFT
jgi:hypothetical protein